MPSVLQRILSALVLAPVVLLTTYLGGIWFLVMVLGIVGVGLFEWWRMCANAKSSHTRNFWAVVGAVYLGLAGTCMFWMRIPETSGYYVEFWLYAIVWGTDTGAYIAGTLIGGPKLASRISPKKTWAGLLGGVAVSGAVGYTAYVHYGVGASLNVMIAASIALAIVSQFGDLLESFAKRSFGVKDSGSLIPGHGGVLDRVDGLFAAALGLAFLRLTFPEALGVW